MLREFLRHLSLELNRSPQTVKAYEADLRGFNDYMANSGVPKGNSGFFIPSAVSSGDLREWLATLTEQGLSTASIRRKVQSLRAYFRYLVRQGELATNPAASLPLPKAGRRLPTIATHADIETSLTETDRRLVRLIIELLYGCGLRRAELTGISDTDINPYSLELKILGKGNKHRIIPLPRPLLDEIRAWQEERDSLYPDLPAPRPLIVSRQGRRMSDSNIYRLVRRALEGSAAEKKSPHTLRHSFATQLLNGGADLNSVKNLLGHSSLGATQIYTHLAFSEVSREWKKAHPRGSKDSHDKQ
ncbi:MAG: tyrosine-type recombinase/integrase [Muribaculaceae bacterium]|nr:tyrosine-type recombinase/integrase [Muribaculaceae bacterium]